MAEYIEREALMKYADTQPGGLISNKSIQFFQAADVAPIRHGRWEKQSGLYSCSECETTCPYEVQADVIEYWASNYCPNCGAKMDGERKEGANND